MHTTVCRVRASIKGGAPIIQVKCFCMLVATYNQERLIFKKWKILSSWEYFVRYRDSLIYAASIYADLIYADVWILSIPWFTRFYSLNYTDFLKGKLNNLYFGGKAAWILFFPWVPLQESGTHGLELLKRPLNLVILNDVYSDVQGVLL